MTLEEARLRMHETYDLHSFWVEREEIARIKAKSYLRDYQAAARAWLYHTDQQNGDSK